MTVFSDTVVAVPVTYSWPFTLRYRTAFDDDRGFQRPWIVPVHIDRRGNQPLVVDAGEGIYDTTAEGLSSLVPVLRDGVITYGSQTHPADGWAGRIVTDEAQAVDVIQTHNPFADRGQRRLLRTGDGRRRHSDEPLRLQSGVRAPAGPHRDARDR